MAALQQHGAAVGIPDFLRGGFHVLYASNLHAGEHLGLRDVGGDQGGQGQQLFRQGLNRVGLHQGRTGGGHHDGIHHHILRPVEPEPVGNHANELAGCHHADFYRVGTDVLKDRVNLLLQKFGSGLLNCAYAGGVLGREGGNGAHGIHTIHGHRFQISLNSGASTAVAARNGQCCFYVHFVSPFDFSALFFIAAQGGAPNVPL